MDINTFKIIRNSLSTKEAEADNLQEKKQEKKDDIKGCLKLSDYMAF